MIRWYKYYIATPDDPAPNVAPDASYEDHADGMGGYESTDCYSSKDAFYQAEFYGKAYGDLEFREAFLLKHLPSEPQDIVSVGAGRGAVEMRLEEHGHKVTCTDLKVLPCLTESRALFPEMKYEAHDILAGPTEKAYDAMLALSLIYLFDEENMQTFFVNAAGSLKPGGSLYVSGSGAPNNLFAWIWFKVCLPLDAHLSTWLRRTLRGRKLSVYRKAFGYRHTEGELRRIASTAGLKLVAREHSGSISDFTRSVFWNSVASRIPAFKRFSWQISRLAPYSRMYHFVKEGVDK